VLLLTPTGDDNAELGLGQNPWLQPGEPDPASASRNGSSSNVATSPHHQPGELYDLRNDLAERHNRFAERPDLVAELTALLRRYVDDGRSTPGPKQANDVPIDLRVPRER
jgi:hypothetical protein